MNTNHYLFICISQVFARLMGYGSEDKDSLEQKDREKQRVFFTHLPLELLPKSALEGGCKVIRFKSVL